MKNKILKVLKYSLIAIVVLIILAIIFVSILLFTRTVNITSTERAKAGSGTYPIVDTGQSTFWNSKGAEIKAPKVSDAFYGQDAQFSTNEPKYKDNGDGTISDLVTGLMWTQTLDINGDGIINYSDKMTLSDANKFAGNVKTGNYSDWRLPTIKELYSLINFSGVDVKPDATESSNLRPFIDTNYFKFAYGNLDSGERIIDAQVATSTIYSGKTFLIFQTMFGVNFADGRIKGYPSSVSMNGLDEKKFYAYYVRGNLAYGVNKFKDNGDGTITDEATKLMWSQNDSGAGMDWEKALAWVQKKNSENYLGHNDWKLPDIKELQSIVDYTRSPEATNTAAIDPLFRTMKIKNEAGQDDYGCYWSSTTHINSSKSPGEKATYISFGRSMGKMFSQWLDVHGAGSQRSDPKVGKATDYPDGFGPQGDAIRIENYVRLVRAL
ncbi:MAG: DUF1566 domain-containing protein [bacterium]